MLLPARKAANRNRDPAIFLPHIFLSARSPPLPGNQIFPSKPI